MPVVFCPILEGKRACSMNVPFDATPIQAYGAHRGLSTARDMPVRKYAAEEGAVTMSGRALVPESFKRGDPPDPGLL